MLLSCERISLIGLQDAAAAHNGSKEEDVLCRVGCVFGVFNPQLFLAR